MKKFHKSSIDSFFDNRNQSVASAQDCTGLTQGPVGNEPASESLEDIYDVSLPVTDTEESHQKTEVGRRKKDKR